MTTIATTAPVVLAADGTTSSAGALRYAVQEASVRGADLRIMHVVPAHFGSNPEPEIVLEKSGCLEQ